MWGRDQLIYGMSLFNFLNIIFLNEWKEDIRDLMNNKLYR
jgi:hypothetical protein